MIDSNFWKNKKVLITGHTGFKGAWLSLWLSKLGANVFGYSLEESTMPSLFQLSGISSLVHSTLGDIRNFELLNKIITTIKPEIVFHLAAQPLVRASYKDPVETYSTNVMGTVNLLEATRNCGSIRTVVNVTTDKCYDNKEWVWGYRENEPLGGFDPYSSSKACSELITAAYRNSFFSNYHGAPAVASARAGNVIGGGDWAVDRLIPDVIRSLLKNETIVIRNPDAIRPWQHVLEPLNGYLILSQKLFEEGNKYTEAWNFGPDESDAKPVKWIVEKLIDKWNNSKGFLIENNINPHEAKYLKLDCSKAKEFLGWKPIWSLNDALNKIVEWTIGYNEKRNIQELCLKQIEEFENSDCN
jgi:CDP-glucose 4,6-dehydratase